MGPLSIQMVSKSKDTLSFILLNLALQTKVTMPLVSSFHLALQTKVSMPLVSSFHLALQTKVSLPFILLNLAL